MTTLDHTRAAIRRRAIADDWPTALLSIAEDFADTAREDGTHALRTREEQAQRLGISEATVTRHRQELQRLGVLRERRKGGRGRGASVMDLVAHSGSRVGATVSPDPVTPDPVNSGSPSPVAVSPDRPDRGSIGAQSGLTVERDREPRPLSSSPTSKQASEQPVKEEQQRQETASMDPATDLAAALDADPAACRAAIAAKTRGRQIDNLPGYVRAIPLDVWRPLVEQHAPQPIRRTLNQCENPDAHDRHPWADARNRYLCQGVG